MTNPSPPPESSRPASTPDEEPPTSPPPSPPPPAPRLRWLIAVVLFATVVLVVGIAIGPRVQTWLDSRSKSEQASEDSDGKWYISQMHPWIIQPEPGQCPICGMDLTPVDPDRFAGEITIDPVVVQNIGVRIAPADRGPIERAIRTVGTVVLDEGRRHDVVQRFQGWVEETMVGARFDRVARGDPLFRVYSPEVFVAEREYLVLRHRSDKDDALLASARRKLELIGIPESEIARLEESGVAADTVTIPSPATGVVWQKNVNAGSEIAPRTVAYQVADLSTVWVEATIYEAQLPFVRVGQEATIELTHEGGVSLRGKVDAVYPEIDPMTRATRARLVFENLDQRLKPGMFATVEILDRLPTDQVRVPSEAIIGTGARKLLFVSLGRGRFEPRDVRVGPVGNQGRTAILEGVAVGEPVVVSGQFLLDSESRMREALAKVMKGTLAGEQAPVVPTSSRSVAQLDAPTRAAFQSALTAYLELQSDLYRSDLATAIRDATKTRAAFIDFIETGKRADEHFHHRVAAIPELTTTSAALGGESLEALRVTFGEVSVALREVILAVGAPRHPDGPWVGMRCGMAEGIRDDGVWLQIGDDARNPYFGDSSGMRSCAVESWGVPDLEGAVDPSEEARASPHTGTTLPEGATRTSIPGSALEAVLAITEALYTEDLESARKSARALSDALGEPPDWEGLVDAARGIVATSDLEAARVALGEIGIRLRDAGQRGLLPGDELWVFRCGMAGGIAEKGVWIQRGGGDPRNPFFGHESGMSDCAVQSWKVSASGLEEVDR